MEYIKKALVVDDNEVWLKLLCKLVSKYYTHVEKATTFDEASSLIHQNSTSYDLIVTDVNLRPGSVRGADGIDLIESVDRLSKLKKCIVVSCYLSHETRVKAERVGASCFVKGIFSREMFWEAVQISFKDEEILTDRAPNKPTIFGILSFVRLFLRYFRKNNLIL